MDHLKRQLLVGLAGVTFIFVGGCSGCVDPTGSGSDGGDVTDGAPTDGAPGDGSAGDLFSGDSGGDSSKDGETSGADSDVDASCPGPVCAGTCCAASEECVEGQCLPVCQGKRCGADKKKCCTGKDLCIGGGCVTPQGNCKRTEDCDVGEICQPSVGKCVPRSAVNVCEYKPPTGKFTPTIGCNWSPKPSDPKSGRGEIEAAPTVVNMSDDNGDGSVDTKDIPDIIFPASNQSDNGCCNNKSTIRIISGKCNKDGSMDTLGSISNPPTNSSTGLAVGDLTGNGVPEVVAVTKVSGQAQGTAAWTQKKPYDGSNWKKLWHNKTFPTKDVHTNGGALVSIADLEADGNPDVIIGNVALDGQNGKLKWDGNAKTNGSGGIGNNAFLGPSSAVADVDLDGKREVAAGNTLYDHKGNDLWTFNFQSRNSSCGGPLPCDGFNAIADFDKDKKGEIVNVRLGEIRIWEHDGTLQWKQKVPRIDCGENESGPPTVADFDGDGDPEVGTAGADYYTVVDPECDVANPPKKCDGKGVLWKTKNQDCSSRVTASSVFDFEGDGSAEMVYADEDNFYILDGKTGAKLKTYGGHSSNTRIEMPLVADTDNDGNSEVVVPAPYGSKPGITIWEDKDDNWVRTRRVWNQHGYSVTNIEEDGTVPTKPNPNWRNSRLNSFRQNQQPAGVFDAPDLQISKIETGKASCAGSQQVPVRVTVTNDGALGASAGQKLVLRVNHKGNTTTIGQKTTTTRLLPGQTETLKFQWTIPSGWLSDGFEFRAEIDPDNDVNECKEGNNSAKVKSSKAVNVKPPPLNVKSLSVKNGMCSTTGKIQVDMTVENVRSSTTIQKGIPIVVNADQNGSITRIDKVKTSKSLSPGSTETFSFKWRVQSALVGKKFDVVVEIDPSRKILKCADVAKSSTSSGCPIGG